MRLPQRGIVVLAGTALTGLTGTRIVVDPVSTGIVVALKLETPGGRPQIQQPPQGRLEIQQPPQARTQQLLQLHTIHRTTRRSLTGRPSFTRRLDGPGPAFVGHRGMMNLRSSTEQRSMRPWQDVHRSHMILTGILFLIFRLHLQLDLLHFIFTISTQRSLWLTPRRSNLTMKSLGVLLAWTSKNKWMSILMLQTRRH